MTGDPEWNDYDRVFSSIVEGLELLTYLPVFPLALPLPEEPKMPERSIMVRDVEFTAPVQMGIDPSWVGSSGLDVEAEVGRKYLEFVKRHHPDQGGDPDIMRDVNVARDAAIAYLSKLGTLPWNGAAS